MKVEVKFTLTDIKDLLEREIKTEASSADLTFYGLPADGVRVSYEVKRRSGPVEMPF